MGCRHISENPVFVLNIGFFLVFLKEYVFHLETLEYNSTRSRLIRLLEELNTDRYGRDTQIAIDIRDLILSLNRTVYTKKHRRSKKDNISSYQAITEYIGTHLEEDLSLDALSRVFFLNRY